MIVGGMSENSIVGHQHASDVADFALLVREVSKLVLSPSGSSLSLITVIMSLLLLYYH